MEKYAHIFDTRRLNTDLKKRSLQSGAVTLGSQAIQFILQLGSTMILARILSPEDYGINAMAVAITGFAAIFSNLGLSTATIQRAEINHEQVSTLFWINTAIGLLITFLVAAISPVAAWFYKTPEMLWVMLSLSVIFLISGLSVQHSALLTRQMKFYSLAKIRIISLLTGILVAIFTGYQGFGYWALVFNTLTNVTVHSLCLWFACKWIPGMPSRSDGIGSMVKFGSDLVVFDVINYFSRNLDNVLIGRYYGSGVLGLYSKAYQLLMMPITNLRNPITSVALPALSRLQDDPEQYCNYYLKCVSLIAFISMPLVAFMFVFSEHLIELLLGSQWIDASEIFKILAIAAFIQPVSGTVGMVLISLGKSRIYVLIGAANALIICFGFLAGLPWGAKGIATSYAVVNYLIVLPNLFYSFKNTSIRLKEFLRVVFKPCCASLLMVGACHMLIQFLKNMDTLMILLIGFSAAFIGYLLSFIFFSRGLSVLRDYFNYGKLIINKGNR
jgi:PST family polysaccharide transporter